MGKHKDPEVADQKGEEKASGQGQGDAGTTAEAAAAGTSGGGARGGRARKGGAGKDSGSKDTRSQKTEEAGVTPEKVGEDAPADESAGAPDSPAKAGKKAGDAAPDRAEGTSARKADEQMPPAEDHAETAQHEHQDDLAYHEETMSDLADQVAEERSHRTLYATLFYVLLGILVVAGLTLWGAPKVAPHVPGFIAQYLVPGEAGTAERVTALEERLAQQDQETGSEIAALQDRLDSLAAEVEAAAAPSEETQAALGAAREAADAAADEVAALAQRLDSLESRLTGMREEVTAVSETLTGAGEGAAPAELAAAINSLQKRVDQLAGTVEGGPPTTELAQRLETLTGRLEELQGNLVAAQEAGTEVSSAIRETRLQSALDTLAARLAAGQPYAAPLSEIAGISGIEAPEALAAAAETGVPTATELEATFGRHAQAAISANIRAASGDNALGEALGWLRAQFAGRPVSEQEGGDVPAITSRIAARIEEGRLDAALSEAESLPEPSREALGSWLERLRARVEAEEALAGWRDQVTAKG